MYGIEAGLGASGDIWEAIANRAGASVTALSRGLEVYSAGQTGMLRLTWDNGDRTVLVNSDLGGVTLGWKLTHTAQDELFAAFEGTALHTRVILERFEEHGVPVRRLILGGRAPQKNEVLNRVYANVLGKPVLVPRGEATGLGAAIFAFLAAGTFQTVEEAQDALCPSYRTLEPDPAAAKTYDRLYELYKQLYFGFGQTAAAAVAVGEILPALRRMAAESVNREL
jgi:L-ribulokinase